MQIEMYSFLPAHEKTLYNVLKYIFQNVYE